MTNYTECRHQDDQTIWLGGVLDFWQLGFGWLLDSSSSGGFEPRGFGWLLLSCSVGGVYL